jgi:hypothetical protein
MKRFANRMTAWGLATVLSCGLSGRAAAQMADTSSSAETSRSTDTASMVNVETVHSTVFRTRKPSHPPATRPELKGSAPSADAVWVAGFWDLRADRATSPRAGWVWVPGRWITPPVPRARWDPGHWGWYDDWYSWIPAHWVVPGRHGYPPSLEADQETELEMSAP